MSTTYDIEICDHCGSEFEVGYWRNDLSLCEECMSMANELSNVVDVMEDEAGDFDADDWAPAELYVAEELGIETAVNGY
ncbi:MAG: hypothetical protein OET44_15035 [Gammaproteobacteria bacterium]|nr:hypothetical protein [Gammaproteobacteria bacterium]